MSTPAPALQHLARKLIAIGPVPVGPSSNGANQAVQAYEKLRVPLTRLAGVAGFTSLQSRALALAKRQAPSLAGLRVGSDGLLRVEEIPPGVDAVDMLPEGTNGGTVLVAELLGLLVVLIGEPLMLSLVREAWPDVSLDTAALSSKESP